MITNIRKFIRTGLQPVIRQVSYSMAMTVRQFEAVALWVAAISYTASRIILLPMIESNLPEFISECIFSFLIGTCLYLMAYATTIPRLPGAKEAAEDIADQQRGTLGWNSLRVGQLIFCLVLLGVVFAPASLLTWSMVGDTYLKAVFSMLLRVVAAIVFIFLMGGFTEED